MSQQVRMYYGSGNVDIIASEQSLHVHSPDGSTFLCDMTSKLWFGKCDVISEIRLCQSVGIHLRNNFAKFHPLAISKGSLRLFSRGRPNKRKKNSNNNNNDNYKMRRDMGSVPDPKSKNMIDITALGMFSKHIARSKYRHDILRMYFSVCQQKFDNNKVTHNRSTHKKTQCE